MSQPVQHQRTVLPRTLEPALDDQTQHELVGLYQRSDDLLRELTTVRRRIDELHATLGGAGLTPANWPSPLAPRASSA